MFSFRVSVQIEYRFGGKSDFRNAIAKSAGAGLLIIMTKGDLFLPTFICLKVFIDPRVVEKPCELPC